MQNAGILPVPPAPSRAPKCCTVSSSTRLTSQFLCHMFRSMRRWTHQVFLLASCKVFLWCFWKAYAQNWFQLIWKRIMLEVNGKVNCKWQHIDLNSVAVLHSYMPSISSRYEEGRDYFHLGQHTHEICSNPCNTNSYLICQCQKYLCKHWEAQMEMLCHRIELTVPCEMLLRA